MCPLHGDEWEFHCPSLFTRQSSPLLHLSSLSYSLSYSLPSLLPWHPPPTSSGGNIGLDWKTIKKYKLETLWSQDIWCCIIYCAILAVHGLSDLLECSLYVELDVPRENATVISRGQCDMKKIAFRFKVPLFPDCWSQNRNHSVLPGTVQTEKQLYLNSSPRNLSALQPRSCLWFNYSISKESEEKIFTANSITGLHHLP